MNPASVSVVMSVYNGEAYLAEAIESILTQTFADFEFIIINDGSRDGTARMLAEYAERDPRVRVVTQENSGRVPSLNRGIEMAAAPFIARMDADDVSLPNRLERQVSFLEAHPEIGLLGSAVEMVGPEGESLGIYAPDCGDQELRQVMMKLNPFRHPAILMRKGIASGVGGYRKVMLDTDDYDLWLRMSERTQIANLPEVLVKYRIHPNQVSVRNLAHQTLCCFAARGAAARRSAGLPDPVENVEEITPELVRKLGFSDEEVRREIAGVHTHWIRVLAGTQPEAAQQLAESLVEVWSSRPLDRRSLASALLRLAGVRFRQVRRMEGLALAGRGIFTHPMEVAHVFRMAVARRMRGLGASALRRSPG
jgi:glycosyltransferase involved in cell wall biosynthesis